MLACSVKINNIKSENGEINGNGKIKILCEEGEKDENSEIPVLF